MNCSQIGGELFLRCVFAWWPGGSPCESLARSLRAFGELPATACVPLVGCSHAVRMPASFAAASLGCLRAARRHLAPCFWASCSCVHRLRASALIKRTASSASLGCAASGTPRRAAPAWKRAAAAVLLPPAQAMATSQVQGHASPQAIRVLQCFPR